MCSCSVSVLPGNMGEVGQIQVTAQLQLTCLSYAVEVKLANYQTNMSCHRLFCPDCHLELAK